MTFQNFSWKIVPLLYFCLKKSLIYKSLYPRAMKFYEMYIIGVKNSKFYN